MSSPTSPKELRKPSPDGWETLFRRAEKEYLDLLALEEPMKLPNKHFCSDGHKHQLVSISGLRTCCLCGLVVGRVPLDYGFGLSNTTIEHQGKSISDKFKSFCTRRKITRFDISAEEKRLVEGDIQEVCDAEKPKRKTLPNLSILTHQICKRHNIEMDVKLLKIPVSKASHDRCKKVFQTLGWDYVV